MAPTRQDDRLERMHTVADVMSVWERRRCFRVPLHWTLYLARQGETYPRRTETLNISRDGFYCNLDLPLIAGEHVDCDIVIPTHTSNSDDIMSLRCHAQVIRVEKVDCGEHYGLACRIVDYRLIHNAKDPGSAPG